MDGRDVVGHIIAALETRRWVARGDLYDSLRLGGSRMCYETIDKYLQRLRQDGIILVEKDPHDARRFLYTLTTDADTLLEQNYQLATQDRGRHRKLQALHRVLETVLSAPDVLPWPGEEKPQRPQQKVKVVRR